MNKIRQIMIIDDDEVNNFICTKIIEKSNLAEGVITFIGAREGLDHIQQKLKSGDANYTTCFYQHATRAL